MQEFVNLIINDRNVILEGIKYKSTLGKHCCWIPDKEMKVILSFNGCIESTAWTRGSNAEKIKDGTLNNENPGFTQESLESIMNEFKMLKLFAGYNMSPLPREYFHIRSVTSSIFTDDPYEDKKGMYGYFVPDANKLPSGKYDFDDFKRMFLNPGIIIANPGAIGDLGRKEGNLVNGYLVDVRRTMKHMMKINLPELDTNELRRS